MNDIEAALGASRRLDPAFTKAGASAGPGAIGRGRVALVAGATGRGGEAMLNAVLARGGYERVVALAQGDALQAAENAGRAAMAMGVARLVLAPLEALPPIDDVYVRVAEPDDAHARSFYGRDARFALVADANLLAVARAAAEAGASRIALVRPLAAWQQLGAFHRAIGNVDELSLAQLPFRRTVIARPVAAQARRGRGMLERMVSVYLSLQLLMLPRSIPTLTSDEVARAVILALGESEDRLTVLGAQQLAERLPRRGAAQRA